MASLKPVSSVRLPPLASIKDLLKLYKLRALKNMSQNFLLDSRVTNKIVKSAGSIIGGEVIEVGAGPGSITRSIINRGPARVIVVEKDTRFQPTLSMLEEASPCRFDTIYADILSLNLSNIFSKEFSHSWPDRPPNLHIIGNLPFNVATPLIIRWLHAISERNGAWEMGRVKLTLTFQKEVAERMVAPILSNQRCRLSLMCQNWCHVNHVFNIPGSAFVPKPDVDVGVVHFVPRVTPVVEKPFKLVEKVVRALFSFRQKYCIRGVSTLFPQPAREKYGAILFEKAQVEPSTRPFQLTIEEVGRLVSAYESIVAENPSLSKYNYRSNKSDDSDSEYEGE